MTRYLQIAMAGVGLAMVIAVVAWVVAMRGELVEARATINGQARTIDALELQAEQARLARDVEAARAARERTRVESLQASINTMLEGDIPDAPLHPDIADFVNGLHGVAAD